MKKKLCNSTTYAFYVSMQKLAQKQLSFYFCALQKKNMFFINQLNGWTVHDNLIALVEPNSATG